ncbi:hypothetical protein [uncultured Reyranella sp.]|jgi:hypothetical protein|nr:hypothetical protein [uncultured Reyranella sp.]
MDAALAHEPCLYARPTKSAAAAWRVCACVIDRSFVVIRLKHPAV